MTKTTSLVYIECSSYNIEGEHPPKNPSFLCAVCVAQSLVFCLIFCRSLYVFCPISFGHCVVCPSYNNGF